MSDTREKQHSGPYGSALERSVVFFLVSMGVVALTYGVLYLVDFLPEKPGEKTEESTATEITEPVAEESVAPSVMTVNDPLPITIYFDSFEREVAVLNPDARDVASLDQALLSGVVRHPDSATFTEAGTMFLFGHSSYLPTVKNKNYQAFNGLQNLEWGEIIRLRSGEAEYVYRVDTVRQAKAADASVAIERGEPKLVLVTCNTFGAKDDRYIVEATLIDTRVFQAVENS